MTIKNKKHKKTDLEKVTKLNASKKETEYRHENMTDNFKIEKLENIKKSGIDPYPSGVNRDYSCEEIKSDFEVLSVKKNYQ